MFRFHTDYVQYRHSLVVRSSDSVISHITISLCAFNLLLYVALSDTQVNL